MEGLRERTTMAGTGRQNRTWSYGTGAVLSSLFFLGILAFIVLIAERHPWRVDMTESGAFTLSEQTRNILNSLEQPITIKAFYATASPEQTKATDVLETYRYACRKLSYEFVDPDRQPEIAKHYEVRSYGTLVLEGYGRRQTIQTADEESITNAILKLSRNEQKKIYFLSGHGERSTQKNEKDGYSTVREALEKENYAISDMNLLQQAQIPADAALVVVAGPEKPLFPQELATLKAYLEGGGRLMVLLNPFKDGGMKEFLKGYGVEVGEDIVIDKLSRVFGGSYLMPVVMQYGHHRISENFDLATFYPEARSVVPAKDPPPGIQLEVLASTSENAWAERNLNEIKGGEVSYDEKEDVPGPISLIVLSEIDLDQAKLGESKVVPDREEKNVSEDEDQKGARQAFLVVAGDSDFADNTYFGLSGNADLFLNIVNFLAEEQNLVKIKPRDRSHQPMLMTQTQAWIVFLVVMVLVPLMVLFSGLVVYRVRRSQR
jgi:ABC-type uncharacterized transport system involved in gliding motility auxiliary subunit